MLDTRSIEFTQTVDSSWPGHGAGLRQADGIRGPELADMLNALPGAAAMLGEARLVAANEEFLRLFDYGESEVLGRSLRELILMEEGAPVIELMKGMVQQGDRVTLEAPCRTRSGRGLLIQMMISPLMLGGSAKGHLIILNEVGESLELVTPYRVTGRHHPAGLYDELTGLPNRQLFLQRAELMLTRLKRCPERWFAVLALTIEMAGEPEEPVGDAWMQLGAESLSASVRPEDTVARMGANHFAVLLGEVRGETEMGYMAQRLKREMLLQFSVDGNECAVSVHVGMAMRRQFQTGDDAQRILIAAQRTMAAAKLTAQVNGSSWRFAERLAS